MSCALYLQHSKPAYSQSSCKVECVIYSRQRFFKIPEMSSPTTPDQLRDLALKYAEEKKKVEWLELFTEDAVVEDPVGKPPHIGKKELSAWWDKSVANLGSFKAEVILSRTCGDECACSLKFTVTMFTHVETSIELISIYKMSALADLCFL